MRVSNGKESYNVSEANLEKARADGFYPVVQVSNGKESYDVRPERVAKARADGFFPLDENPAKQNAIEPEGMTAGQAAGGLLALGGGALASRAIPALRAGASFIKGVPAPVSSTGGIISAAESGGLLKPAAKEALGTAWRVSKPYLKEGAKWVLGYEALKGLLRNAPALIPEKERSAPAALLNSGKEGISRAPQSMDGGERTYKNIRGIGSPTGPYKSGLAYNLAAMRQKTPGLLAHELPQEPEEDRRAMYRKELDDFLKAEGIEQDDSPYYWHRGITPEIAKKFTPELRDYFERMNKFYQNQLEESARAEAGGDYELDPYEYGDWLIKSGRGEEVPFPKSSAEHNELMDFLALEAEKSGLTAEEDESLRNGLDSDLWQFMPDEDRPETAEDRIWRQNREAEEENPNWLWGPSYPKKDGGHKQEVKQYIEGLLR